MDRSRPPRLDLPAHAWESPREVPGKLVGAIAAMLLVVELAAAAGAVAGRASRDASLILAVLAVPSALLFAHAYLFRCPRRPSGWLRFIARFSMVLNGVLVGCGALAALLSWAWPFRHGHH